MLPPDSHMFLHMNNFLIWSLSGDAISSILVGVGSKSAKKISTAGSTFFFLPNFFFFFFFFLIFFFYLFFIIFFKPKNISKWNTPVRVPVTGVAAVLYEM